MFLFMVFTFTKMGTVMLHEQENAYDHCLKHIPQIRII